MTTALADKTMQTRRYSYLPWQLDITGDLELVTPLHAGTGGGNALTDAAVLRLNGRPYLPATSLRGVLRHLLQSEACLLGCTGYDWQSLFGESMATAGKEPFQSRLTIRSSFLDAGAQPTAEIRDHVRMERAWAAAAHGGKFDNETILPGRGTFKFHASYEGDAPDDRELILFGEALRLLAEGEVQVGAKTGWGYGRIRLREGWETRVHDRRTPAGLAGFLGITTEDTLATVKGGFCFPPPLRHLEPTPGLLEPYALLSLVLDIQCDGPVLIKSAFPEITDAVKGDIHDPATYYQQGRLEADQVPLACSDGRGRYYLPGSSLRGVWRGRADWMGASGFRSQNDSKILFGTASDQEGKQGLIRVFDGDIVPDSARLVYLDHVAVDRITHAADDGSKFANLALASPRFRVPVRAYWRRDNRAALILLGHLIRDLCDGLLWIGSNTARGYGKIACVKTTDAKASVPMTWDWRLDGGVARGRQVKEFGEDLAPFWKLVEEHK